MNFQNYLKGKVVAFVGACPNIKGEGHGSTIDAADVVVKTNGSVYLDSPEYRKDYGSRIDVLYCNNQFQREMDPFPTGLLHQRGTRFVRMKACKAPLRKILQNDFDVEVIDQAMARVNSQVRGALMGAYILQDLIMREPKQIFVTGIDFFQSKRKVFKHDDYREYLDGYLPAKIREQGNRINVGKTEDGHSQLENTKFIHSLWLSGRLLFPPKILSLMTDIVDGKKAQE